MNRNPAGPPPPVSLVAISNTPEGVSSTIVIISNRTKPVCIGSAKVGHVNQVLPIVRYWIPHIRIISPEGLQTDMEKDLRGYLDKICN